MVPCIYCIEKSKTKQNEWGNLSKVWCNIFAIIQIYTYTKSFLFVEMALTYIQKKKNDHDFEKFINQSLCK